LQRIFNKIILWFCIITFVTIWYQIIYTISCNFLCEKPKSEYITKSEIDYENMTPEELKLDFEKIRLERIEQMNSLE